MRAGSGDRERRTLSKPAMAWCSAKNSAGDLNCSASAAAPAAAPVAEPACRGIRFLPPRAPARRLEQRTAPSPTARSLGRRLPPCHPASARTARASSPIRRHRHQRDADHESRLRVQAVVAAERRQHERGLDVGEMGRLDLPIAHRRRAPAPFLLLHAHADTRVAVDTTEHRTRRGAWPAPRR